MRRGTLGGADLRWLGGLGLPLVALSQPFVSLARLSIAGLIGGRSLLDRASSEIGSFVFHTYPHDSFARPGDSQCSTYPQAKRLMQVSGEAGKVRRSALLSRHSGNSKGTSGAPKRFINMDQERIIAVALLTRRDLNLLGPTFSRAWPVEDAPDFHELLTAIDEADAELRRKQNSVGPGAGPGTGVNTAAEAESPDCGRRERC